jgi:hypothetical protein
VARDVPAIVAEKRLRIAADAADLIRETLWLGSLRARWWPSCGAS